MSSTAVTQALAVLASLSLEEKLRFLTTFTADFAKSYTKDAKKGKKAKASDSDAKAESKPRKTHAATYAWLTYEKEVMRLHPELFVGIVHVAARRKIVSDYKKEHEDHYAAYAKKYKEDLEAGLIQPPMSEKLKKKLGVASSSLAPLALVPDSSDAEEEEVVPTPAEAVVSVGKVKAAEMKKKLAEKKAAAPAASESSSNAAPSTEAPTPAPEPVVGKKKKSVVKKAKSTATEAKPEEGQEFITVDGKNYIRLLENNGCFIRHDNGTFGAWEGVYDEETKTIRKTASPSDV